MRGTGLFSNAGLSVSSFKLLVDVLRGNPVIPQQNKRMKPQIGHLGNDLGLLVIFRADNQLAGLLADLSKDTVLAHPQQGTDVGILFGVFFPVQDDLVDPIKDGRPSGM